MQPRLKFAVGIIFLIIIISDPLHAQIWPQWGGPDRNFVIKSAKLADRWAPQGPPLLWKRSLGDGYSGIVGNNERIYTMYRPERLSTEEVIVAINPLTGKTIWEKRFASPLTEPVDSMGQGPNATPILAGDYLYTISTNAVVHCLDQETGKLRWKRDLYADFKSPHFGGYGFSSSPLIYRDKLIIPLGYRPASKTREAASTKENSRDERNRALIALRLKDGELAWQGQDYVVWQSSPILIEHAGQAQVVVLMTDALAAVDPESGKELWRFEFETGSTHCTSPFWNGKDLLIFPSGGPGAGRAIRLVDWDGQTKPVELWANRRVNSMIYPGMPVKDTLLMPGESRIHGFDLNTGARRWAMRGFDSASCILADGKLILLDRNGKLTLAKPRADGLSILGQCQASQRDSLTCPTLIDRKLFIRDRQQVMAYDLGSAK